MLSNTQIDQEKMNEMINEIINNNRIHDIRVAINDLDAITRFKLDEKYNIIIDDLHCILGRNHYLRKTYSTDAYKYGKYLLLQKLKTSDEKIIKGIDGMDEGFVDAIIKSIETECIEVDKLIIDSRQKYMIEQYWK